jgi:hypothetical protein
VPPCSIEAQQRIFCTADVIPKAPLRPVPGQANGCILIQLKRPPVMKQKPYSRRKRITTKSVLRLPDLEHAKAAVLNSLTSPLCRSKLECRVQWDLLQVFFLASGASENSGDITDHVGVNHL